MEATCRWGGWLLRARSGYVLRDIAGEYLLIPVALQDGSQSQMAILNEEGKFLWELLQEDQTVETLVNAMTDSYDVTAEVAEKDICELLDHLTTYHLISKMEVRK